MTEQSSDSSPVGPPVPTLEPGLADKLSDEELDELPFGVICLSAKGIVLRFNRAEGRFARLDPASVVGRNFFSDIAPCASGDFLYRFRDFVDSSDSLGTSHFFFTFDFAFGSQDVKCEMIRVPGADRYYLNLTRQRFLPRSDNATAHLAAPRQSELSPREADLGVQRDVFANRVVIAPSHLFDSFELASRSLPPDARSELTEKWGQRIGRRLVLDLEGESLERCGKALREQPMNVVAEMVSETLREAGWGLLSLDFSNADRGAVVAAVEYSILAVKRRPHRSCQLLAAVIEGILSHLAERRLHCEEVTCRATGASCCKMLIVGAKRRERVETLCRRSVNIDAIIQGLDSDVD